MFNHEKKKTAPIDISSAPMHSPKKEFEDIYEYKRTLSKHSKEILKKGSSFGKLNQHFVGLSQPNPETKSIIHFIVPTVELLDSKNLSINSFTRKKIEESTEDTIQIFGKDEVASVRDIPGEAHRQGKKVAQTKDTFRPGNPTLGWASYLYDTPSGYSGRSWLNEDIFELHPIAHFAFYFDFKKMGYFSFGAYTNQERLRRTIPTDFFESLTQDLQEKAQDILDLEDTPPYKIDDRDVKEYEALWDKIKKDPEKKDIAILMMQTIYNASGLNLTEETQFLRDSKGPDQTIIQQALDVASAYEIKLDLEYIPPFFPTDRTNDATALLLAAKKGDLKSVTALIDAKANIHAKDNKSNNILHYALVHKEILQYLLSHQKDFGLNINEENKLGESALIAAVQNGNTPAVKLLLEAKAETTQDQHNVTPLHHAARTGNIDVIKLLLPQKTLSHLRASSHFTPSDDFVSTLDKNLNTPLHYFASSRVETLNPEIIELFRKDINKKNDEDLTPLGVAFLAGDGEMAKVLLDHKANVDLLPSALSSAEGIQQFLSQMNLKIDKP